MHIELHNLTYIYPAAGDVIALEDVSLRFRTGEAVLVLGHAGAGKSTLLHLLAGLLKPSSGRVVFDDGVRASLALQQPERQLFCGSVFDEVAFGLRQTNRSRKAAFGRGAQEDLVTQQVDSALLGVGLDPRTFVHRHPQQLSGGEKRRLAIACSLAMKPDFLLLDEPLAGLDGPGRRSLLQVLRGLRSNGTGVILTSHTVEPLLPIADRVLLLWEGRVAGDGSPADLLGDLSLLSACGVEPPGTAAVAKRLQERGWPALEWSTPDILADSILTHLNHLDVQDLEQGDSIVESRLQPVTLPARTAVLATASPAIEESRLQPVTSLPGPPFLPQLPAEASTPRIGEDHLTLDPRSRLISTLILMVPLLLAPAWIVLGVYALILLAGMGLTGQSKAVSRVVFPVTLLGFSIAAFSALAAPGEKALLGGLLPVSVDGLEVGARSGIRMVELVALGALLAATTPPDRLAAAVARIISPLRRLGVDVPSLEFLVLLVFRFVPILKAEFAATETAMYLRGARYGKNPVDQIRRLSVLPVPLLRRLLVASDEMAIALLSRGYRLDGSMPEVDMRFRPLDLAAIAGSAILAVCVMALTR